MSTTKTLRSAHTEIPAELVEVPGRQTNDDAAPDHPPERIAGGGRDRSRAGTPGHREPKTRAVSHKPTGRRPRHCAMAQRRAAGAKRCTAEGRAGSVGQTAPQRSRRRESDQEVVRRICVLHCAVQYRYRHASERIAVELRRHTGIHVSDRTVALEAVPADANRVPRFCGNRGDHSPRALNNLRGHSMNVGRVALPPTRKNYSAVSSFLHTQPNRVAPSCSCGRPARASVCPGRPPVSIIVLAGTRGCLEAKVL